MLRCTWDERVPTLTLGLASHFWCCKKSLVKPSCHVSSRYTSRTLLGRAFGYVRSSKQTSYYQFVFFFFLLQSTEPTMLIIPCFLCMFSLLSVFCSFSSFNSAPPVFRTYPHAFFAFLLITVQLKPGWELLGREKVSEFEPKSQGQKNTGLRLLFKPTKTCWRCCLLQLVPAQFGINLQFSAASFV